MNLTLANRVLNIFIAVMALVALVMSIKLFARRKELRERGDALAMTVSDIVETLDEKSPEPRGDTVFAKKAGGEGALGWAEYHEGPSNYKRLLVHAKDHAAGVHRQRNTLSKHLVDVGTHFEFPEGELTDLELNDPGKSTERLETLDAYLDEFYQRDLFLTQQLAKTANMLDETFDDTDFKRLRPKDKYTETRDKVEKDLADLKGHRDRLSDAMYQTVTTLGGESRLGVTAEQARQALPSDIEAMKNGLEGIIDKVREAEILSKQVEVLGQELVKAKEDLTNASEDIDRWTTIADTLKNKVDGQGRKIAKLEYRIIKLTGGEGTGEVIPTKALNGTVVKVNYDYDYVIIDLGAKDDLLFDTQLSVARHREFICTISVTRVYKNFAVAEIIPKNRQGNVIEGDRVVWLE